MAHHAARTAREDDASRRPASHGRDVGRARPARTRVPRRLPHSRGRAPAALGHRVRAGADDPPLEGRRGGRARRADARREGRGVSRGLGPARRRVPAPLPHRGRVRRGLRNAEGVPRRRQEDAARPPGRARRRERLGSRRGDGEVPRDVGSAGPDALLRCLQRRPARRAARALLRPVAGARRDPGHGERPRRLHREALGPARPPVDDALGVGARAVGRQEAQGQLLHVPRPAPAGSARDMEGEGRGAEGIARRSGRRRSCSPTCTTAASMRSRRTLRPILSPSIRCARAPTGAGRTSGRRRFNTCAGSFPACRTIRFSGGIPSSSTAATPSGGRAGEAASSAGWREGSCPRRQRRDAPRRAAGRAEGDRRWRRSRRRRMRPPSRPLRPRRSRCGANSPRPPSGNRTC